ncbi:MAG: hypothetical protein KBC56_04325 [Flavobacterium sp.]|nr:hypothetical protein [Flavobacterium sp.]
MKKYLLLLLIAFSFSNCELGDDDNPKFHLELLPVATATFPAEFKKDSIYQIPIQFNRPTNCYIYDGFYYEKNRNERLIAVQTSVVEQNDCGTMLVNPMVKILTFKPTIEESYIFKLWKGKGSDGADIFEEIEIPVIP